MAPAPPGWYQPILLVNYNDIIPILLQGNLSLIDTDTDTCLKILTDTDKGLKAHADTDTAY